jgi:hypothetical protein
MMNVSQLKLKRIATPGGGFAGLQSDGSGFAIQARKGHED